MTDESGLTPANGKGKTVMYRSDAKGGLQAVAPEGDYRDELRSRRWNAAPLENPEAEKTDPWIAIAVIVGLSVMTLVILVVGYGLLGIWGLPA